MLKDYIACKPEIENDLVRLRTMRKADVPDLKEWMPDKEMYKYWGKNAGRTDKAPELLFEKEEKPTKSFHYGIEYKKDSKIVGEIWLYLIENDRIGKIAIRVSPKYQRRGIASNAVALLTDFCFTNTELQRLWSDVHIENAASCKMLEHCGYTREGHIRQGKMVSTFCDYYIYGILKDDIQ